MRTSAAVQAQGSAAMQWLSQGSAQGGSGIGKSSCRQRYRDGGSAGLAWLGRVRLGEKQSSARRGRR